MRWLVGLAALLFAATPIDQAAVGMPVFCAGVSRAANVAKFRDARERLIGLREAETSLLEFGAILKKAGEACLRRSAPDDHNAVGYLLMLLAFNWEVRRNLTYASQLYELSYEVLSRDPNLVLSPIATLQNWANLEVTRGHKSEARRLAGLQTAIARAAYTHRVFSSAILLDALEFEASILDRLGDGDGAKVREEMARLVAKSADEPETKP